MQKLNYPDVRQFNDVVVFLKHCFDWRKSLDSTFNQESWSSELGYKSPTFMYLISVGKRNITAAVSEKLTLHFGFNSEQKKHFALLVEKNNTESNDLKISLEDKILESLNYHEIVLDKTYLEEFVSSKTMPLIKILLDFKNSQFDVNDLARLLATPVESINADLIILEKLNLVKQTNDTQSSSIRWQSTVNAFRFPIESKDQLMNAFHSNSLCEAKEILNSEIENTKFRSVIFAAQPAEFSKINADIENFINKLKNKYSDLDLNNKQLFKVNLQAYPVSEVCFDNKENSGTI